jgi:hypothetical protein
MELKFIEGQSLAKKKETYRNDEENKNIFVQ